MSEYDIQTRLFGKEDIDFDTEGTGAQTEYTDLDGNTHPVTKLNAEHIPITQSARIATEGATNVDGAVKTLSKEIRDLAGQNGVGQSEDRIIFLLEQDSRQTQINEPFRNLGGHTLTFKFPEEGDVQVALAPLEFQGFYNGVLVIDLNGCDIHDNGTFSPEGVLRIKNCHCHVRIIGDGRSSDGYGKIIFTDNHYGIAVIESPSCSVEHMAFESSSTADDFALYTESGNAFFTSCTFTGCGRALIKSIYRDYVDAHMVDDQAHAALFAGKAALSHAHTEAHVSGLETDLANKAPLHHSHSLDDITNFSSGSLNSAASAGVAEDLVNSAKTTIIQSAVSSAAYNGPFAVSVGYGGSAADINGGYVFAGGTRHLIGSAGEIAFSSGATLYLVLSSGSEEVESQFTTTLPSTITGNMLVTRLAENTGGVAKQFQFGDITCAQWGGGMVQDLSVSVSGNTASIGLSGSTATAQLVGTGDVEITGNTNGQIEIKGSGIPLSTNAVSIGFNGSHVMTNNGWAYMACTIESLGNSASSAYAYLRVISGETTTDYLVALCGLWTIEGQTGGSIMIPVASGSTVTSFFDFPNDGNYTAGSMAPNGIICYD